MLGTTAAGSAASSAGLAFLLKEVISSFDFTLLINILFTLLLSLMNQYIGPRAGMLWL
jgi:hypothetical protein